MAERKWQKKQKRALERRTKRRRRRVCAKRQGPCLILVFLAMLSVRQWRQAVRQSLEDLIKQVTEDNTNMPSWWDLFQTMQQKSEESLEPDIPPSAENAPLFNYNTLKMYESSRLKAILGNDDAEAEKLKSSQPQQPLDAMESHLVSVRDASKQSSYVPLFWHIPKAGGTTIHDLAAKCLNLTIAHASGTNFGHENDTSIQVFSTPSKLNFVNVDVTTRKGLQRANEMGFPENNPSDLMITSLLADTTQLTLTPQHQGFAFTIMRHPVERSISMFHYLQKAYWEPTFRPEFANWTLVQYANREDIDSNWMVRFLVDKPGSREMNPLSREDLEHAKQLVRDKVMVGFTDRMRESVLRFGDRFGWSKLPEFQNCTQTVGSSNKGHQYAEVDGASAGWQALAKVNSLDIELYEYARSIWSF